MKVERVDVSRDGLPAYLCLKTKHPSVGIAGEPSLLILPSFTFSCQILQRAFSTHNIHFFGCNEIFIKFWTDSYYITCVCCSFSSYDCTNIWVAMCQKPANFWYNLKPVLNMNFMYKLRRSCSYKYLTKQFPTCSVWSKIKYGVVVHAMDPTVQIYFSLFRSNEVVFIW